MELNLQPRAETCLVSGRPFVEGDRIVSFLVRGIEGTLARCDVLAGSADGFAPPGSIICRWARIFKPALREENSERALKLSAENLFLTLADPANELSTESTRLLQFLALMLERKRLLKPKGASADGTKTIFDHVRTRQLYEVPAGEPTPEFFLQVQAQLSVLMGPPAAKPAERAPDQPVSQ